MVSNIFKVMLMVTLTWFPCANATIQILSTRVAFNANESEQTVRVNNLSKNPELVQVWLSSTDKTDGTEKENLPFFINPPAARVNGQKGKFSVSSRQRKPQENTRKIAKRCSG